MDRLTRIGKVSPKASSQIAASRIGIGFEKLDRGLFDPEKAYDKVAALGVKKIRLQSGWLRTETQKGVYDFSWLDTIVDNLLSRGLEPWLDLCYGNPLYVELARERFGGVGCPPITPEAHAAWCRYVTATVSHFKGRISLYEVWNEPDALYSWKHKMDDERDFYRNGTEYGNFVLETSRAIREADRSAEIAAFALGRTWNLQFVTAALDTGMAKEIDYVSYHVYSLDSDRAERAERLAELVHQYNPEVRMIQGESGAQSRPDGSGALKRYAWTQEKQRTHLLRLLLQDLSADVAFTSYFSTMDMVEALHGTVSDKASCLDYGYFGVLSAEFDENGVATGSYTEKPAYHALAALASLFGGDVRRDSFTFQRECLPSLRTGGTDYDGKNLVALRFRLDDGSRVLAYWNHTHLLTETYEGTVSFSFYRMGEDTPELCDLRDGTIYALPEDMVESAPGGMLMLKNLPLLDAPLLLRFPAKR